MNFRPDPKPSTFRSKKLREVVRTIRCVDCGAQDGTIVGAHGNQFKGMAIKASDASLIALCHVHHTLLDQGGQMTRDERRAYEKEMNYRTLVALVESGILHT